MLVSSSRPFPHLFALANQERIVPLNLVVALTCASPSTHPSHQISLAVAVVQVKLLAPTSGIILWGTSFSPYARTG